MVPKLSKGAGIKGTALYVLHDKRTEEERALGAELTPEHQSSRRVGTTVTRNLSTDDPELAWRLMCATAANRDALKEAAGIKAGGRQTKNFCGHLSLSWELQTKPDAAEMARAADGALQALGWDKLQALIVEHRDADHAHCHVVVCLIDPETGRTAPNSKNDYEKLQRWAHEYDKERGIEACPDRAARMERAPDDPTPPEPARRWLSRKEYEALKETERAETRTQALGRYRTAAAEVREAFRPEWAAHYKQARAELRAFDRDATRRFTDLANVTRPDQLVAFYNQHRELIWRGISDDQRPGNNHTLLTKGFLQGAIERGQELDRELLLMQHDRSKGLLQERHTEARQEAYRAAWAKPAPQIEAGQPGAFRGPDRQGAAVSGAVPPAANTNRQDSSAERDLQDAADRIRRQPARVTIGRDTETRREGAGGAAAAPATEDLEALRRRVEERKAAFREQWQQGPQDRHRDFGRDRRRD